VQHTSRMAINRIPPQLMAPYQWQWPSHSNWWIGCCQSCIVHSGSALQGFRLELPCWLDHSPNDINIYRQRCHMLIRECA
jgi:hypothetical protein